MKGRVRIGMLIWVTLFAQIGFSVEGFSTDNVAATYKEAKVYFDVNVGEPDKLAKRLQLIDKTYNDLRDSGLVPRFVIGIRGKASNFFTKDNDYVLESDIPLKKTVLSRVAQFKSAGFHLEQCGLAANMQGIAIDDFLPQLEMVGNGYVSMIGYQHQGYAYVPMD
jgi:uncharacterized protein